MSNTIAHESAEAPHLVAYGTFVKVWVALVVLTLALVGLSMTHVPNLALLGLLVITPTKASLVLLYFMHLKHENAALKYMVAAAIGAIIIFIALTFSDYWFR